MRVLVTGGSGLLGSHVIERVVARGWRARALVRHDAAAQLAQALGAEPVRGDVTDRASVVAAARGADGIVHAAALVAQPANFDLFEAVNVWGAVAAVEAAAAAGARLVHVSSTSVYGRVAVSRAAPRSIAEHHPFARIARRDFYGRTKRAGEDAVVRCARRLNAHVVLLRPCVMYGERDRLFARRVATAFRLGVVPLVGDGKSVLACVYAGNAAEAVLRALEADVPSASTYNVAGDGALTAREFFEHFASGFGARPLILPLPRALAGGAARLHTLLARLRRPTAYPGVGRAAVRFLTQDNPFDATRAREELGWCPTTDPAEAVRRTGESFANAL